MRQPLHITVSFPASGDPVWLLEWSEGHDGAPTESLEFSAEALLRRYVDRLIADARYVADAR